MAFRRNSERERKGSEKGGRKSSVRRQQSERGNRQLKDDPKWVARMEQYFDFIDKEGAGKINVLLVQNWATNMEKYCKATPSKMVKLRAQLYTFWGKVGLKPLTFMSKAEFVQNVNNLGMEEVKGRDGGGQTALEKLNNAWFAVVDANNDGMLSLDELQNMMRATGMNPEGAITWLQHMDSDGDGGIKKPEFIESEHNFWYKGKGVRSRSES